jgi:hypothetical protein
VHLAVFAAKSAICIENCRCVVINAGGAFLEEGSYQRYIEFASDRAKALRGRAGNRLG